MSLSESRKFDHQQGEKFDYWQKQCNKLGHNPNGHSQEYQDFLRKANDKLLRENFIKMQMGFSNEVIKFKQKNDGWDFNKFRNLSKEGISGLSSEERLQYRDFLVSRVHDNKVIARVQANLLNAGYDLGQYGIHGVDGKKGTLTTKAIKNFQESIGLKPTGELDQETWLALELVTTAGIRKSEIERLGQILRKDNKQLSEGNVQELKYNQGNELDLNLKIEQFVAVAEKEFQKGFKENNGDNMTPYGKWYGLDGQPWCAMFVSWCAEQAGLLNTYVPKFASVQYGLDWYRKKGRYHIQGSGYFPKAGDVIFFKNNKGQNHTGIVVAYDSVTNIVYTIEGNSNNSIASRKYNLNNSYIQGFGATGGLSDGKIPRISTDGVDTNIR